MRVEKSSLHARVVNVGIVVSLCLFLFSSKCWSQSDSLSVESTGHCYSSEVTPEDGWRRALQDAEANAIRTALGITVSGHTFQMTSESMKGDKPTDYLSTFSELNTTTTSGRVIAEHIMDSTLGTEGNLPVYTIKIQATVAKDKGEPDPGFQVEIHLDKDVFYDRGGIDRNDAVDFSISATMDCYLYIFDIMANDSVMLLMPNAYFTDNFYSAAEGAKGFQRKLAKLPYDLRVGLPPKKDLTTEMIYVVALKKKIDFHSSSMTQESSGILPTYQSAILDLQKWLVRIPQDLRTTASGPFTIKRLK
ncbi:MAG TPA: DUF4384 domain-containing protein [Candidatus Acidoferrales bacterium]|nr:DUF4384 domain-containing protein [Candidatus Acidoferrales bacterium]